MHFVPMTSDSVTRCLDYFFNIWPFCNIENLPKHIKLAKVSTKFCQIVKYPFKKLYKIMPKWRNFAKSGCTDIRTNFLIIFFSKMLIKSMPMKHGWSIRICKKAFLVLVPELRRCLTRRWPTRARRSRRTGPRLLGPHPERTIRFYEGT